MIGASPGAKGASTRTGWMNEDIWPEFLDHLIQHTKCTPDHPMLLILDNLKAHISLKAVEKTKSDGIVLLTLPPHTSHHMQPLDVAVYGLSKTIYSRALDGWMRSNQGKTASIYQILGLVNQAFLSVTPRNITSGFKSTGIFPYNSSVFPEEAFAPSMLSDRPNPELQPASIGPSTSDSIPQKNPGKQESVGEQLFTFPCNFQGWKVGLVIWCKADVLIQVGQAHVLTPRLCTSYVLSPRLCTSWL